VAVYTATGPGRVALDAFYSAARKDFWILASAASRAEAIAAGYVLIGPVGYGLASTSISA